MKFDAFSAGITPGGLRSKNDIKLLICYILSSIKAGLSKEDLVSVLQENSLANYFEINSAISELLKSKNIESTEENSNLYTVTDSGKIVSSQLYSSLPIAIRDKALNATIKLLAKIKRETENTVSIKEIENGYQLNCKISGGDVDLLSFSLYVPDRLQADMVKENFQSNPDIIYECVLAILTKDKNLAKDILNKLQ